MTKKLDDLYFGVTVWDFNSKGPEAINLFGSCRVLASVASYAKMSKEERKKLDDPLRYCFGDTWGRVEWEFAFGSPFPKDFSELQKLSVYEAFVEPNRKYLMSLVESVSEEEGKAYLREYYRPFRERLKRARAEKKAN